VPAGHVGMQIGGRPDDGHRRATPAPPVSTRAMNVSGANEMRGAKRGANDGRHQATPSTVQRLSLQVNGTCSRVQRHPATP
jgi:hypothetical protein